MKYLLISIFVATQILSASEYPKMDTISGRSPRYMYVYPEIMTPNCHPWRDLDMAQWRKEKNEDILVEDAQNALFYTSFERIAKKNKAYIYNSRHLCVSRSNSLGLSRTVLNMQVVESIKKGIHLSPTLGGLDALFINYSHADDYSLMGTPCDDLPHKTSRDEVFRLRSQFRKDFHLYPSSSSEPHNPNDFAKMEERLLALEELEKIGTKVYIYNRFYNIPSYISNHRNVQVLMDKDDFKERGKKPNYYSWVNKDGTKINGGFLGIPFTPVSKYHQDRVVMYDKGYIALKVHGKVYNYKFRNLNEESQKLALSLLGSYPHIGKMVRDSAEPPSFLANYRGLRERKQLFVDREIYPNLREGDLSLSALNRAYERTLLKNNGG
jgi:hypothetical protein